MTNKDSGGPAFPCEFGGTYQNRTSEGISIRDYFAAKAMQAYCGAHPNLMASRHAKEAYEMADAMLLERAK